MKIVKFCKTIYRKSALKSGKIRIGTFDLYKNIENEILQDKEEGMAKYTYIGHKPLTEDDNDKLFAHSPYKLINGWEMQMNGCPLHLEMPQFNTFIFSCSQIKHNEIKKTAKHLKYENYYQIDNLEAFALEIARQISVKYNNANVKFHHDKITYIESKATIVSEDEKDTLEIQKFRMEDFFEKNKYFIDDKEYRFLWIVSDDTDKPTYQSITVDSIDIKSKKLKEFISHIRI